MPILTPRANYFLSRLVSVLEWHRLGQYLPWIVLSVSLAITYKLWNHEELQTLRDLQTDFDSRTLETLSNVQHRMITYEQVLRGVQGLFSASGSVDRNKLYSYVSTLKLERTFPGIQAIGFSPLVPLEKKAELVDSTRKEGLPGYVILPEGDRPLYAPILFVEPFSETNFRSLGLDNYADPARREAMNMARDNDTAVITSKLLLQETDRHVRAGFMMFLPVYRSGLPHDTLARRRANLIGWVYAASRMQAMMEGIRGSAYTDLDIELHDGDSMANESLMYDSDISASHMTNASQAQFRSSIRFAVANHYWTLASHSLPGFDYQLEGGKPEFIAYAGIGGSILLSMLTWLLVYGRARALLDAQEISQSESRYRQMFEENASIAYLLDPETGRIVDANAAALAFWGYSREELRDMNISRINIVPSSKVAEAMEKIKHGTTHRIEMYHRTKSGEIRDVEVFSGPLNVDGKTLRYSIAHDITARKRAEDALKLSSTVFNTVEDGVMVTGPDNLIIAVNPAFSAITGYSPDEVIGKSPRILSSGRHPQEFYRKMWETLIARGNWHGEIWDRRKNGEIYLKWLVIKLVRDESGNISHHVAVFSDLEERHHSAIAGN